MLKSEYSKATIDEGIESLLSEWGRVINKYIDDSDYQWEEYINDLDGRKIIEQAVLLLDEQSKKQVLAFLEPIDELFITKTRESKCVWGKENEALHGWNKVDHWWYYRLPIKGQINI